jgi:hypothetical protein
MADDVTPDDVQTFLEEQADSAATVKQIAFRLDAPPDKVRRTVERMGDWGVLKSADGPQGTVWRLVDGGEMPDDASDEPCPLGCGYRPETARRAFVHLLAHAVGRNSTGRDQRTAAE